tara:strand:- start:896 stop:1087 length:192 start_codon:yes stop_codon:yes gene_type:complete
MPKLNFTLEEVFELQHTLKNHINEHTDKDLMNAYIKLCNVEMPEVVHNFDYDIPEYKGRNINK